MIVSTVSDMHHHQSSNPVNGICNHPEAKHLGDKVGIFMLDLNPLNLIGLDLNGNRHHQWAPFLIDQWHSMNLIISKGQGYAPATLAKQTLHCTFSGVCTWS